jgi:biopolymer transport protein TolR
MLQTWRKPAKVFSDFNTVQFAGVMGMVVFVMLLSFMTVPTGHHGGISTDLAKVDHPVSMPSADREDAMTVVVTRDGRLFFRSDQITSDMLPEKIANHLKDPSVERKVYIKADARARWGAVKLALDGVRAAGILRIAILTDQRRSAALHM